MDSEDDPTATDPEPTPPADPRVSVMEWLVGVGTAIAHKVRTVPTSSMVRIPVRRPTGV